MMFTRFSGHRNGSDGSFEQEVFKVLGRRFAVTAQPGIDRRWAASVRLDQELALAALTKILLDDGPAVKYTSVWHTR